MAEYVYGIVDDSTEAPDEDGIAGARIRVLGADGVAALISDVAVDDLRFGREEMVAHARVLEAAVRRGTVLPMRFGVVMEEAEVLERLLHRRRDELAAQLQELAGRVQYTVRVLYEEKPLMRDLAATPEIAQLRRRIHGLPEAATYYERIQLGELVAAALERRRAADAQELLDELRQVSLAGEESAPAHERVVLNASFLLERGQLPEFDAVLDRQAARRAGSMRFKCVGPLAPHSFVELIEAV